MRIITTLLCSFIVATTSFTSMADIVCRTDSNSLSDELIITRTSSGKFRAEILNRLIVSNLKHQAERSMGVKIDDKLCNVKVLKDGVLRLDMLYELGSNFASREYCPYIVQEDEGFRITFPYLYMPNTRNSQIIEIANWKFNDCNESNL